MVQKERNRLLPCFGWFDYFESQCRSQNNEFHTTFYCLILNGIVCWWDWNMSRRFVFVFVIVSPFCRDIPWVEVDLATWATEKKTFSHFSLSFMYYFGVNLDCGRHTDHCSQVVAYAFITVMLQDRMLEMNSMTIQWLQSLTSKLLSYWQRDEDISTFTTWFWISMLWHWHLSCSYHVFFFFQSTARLLFGCNTQ